MLSAIVNKGLRANFGLFAEMGATPLTGCGDSDPDHARKVRCTELQGIASDGFRGKIPKEDYIKATDEWEKLKCHRSDVIQG